MKRILTGGGGNMIQCYPNKNQIIYYKHVLITRMKPIGKIILLCHSRLILICGIYKWND